ncbi:hypothetical protein [Levilactobacillus tujiorum]|uniref:hypothetical protein n=1 Tax=Levilactobacillus tujiorum TaxID=2912243 RepID=UPI0014564BA9|nr:hypothetical protein [Levilactobacillus tujiorum]NLR32195.1 hypothetical protein [Levilactobacillus tujiorum]
MNAGSAPRLTVLGLLIIMGGFAVFNSPLFSINQLIGAIGVILLTGVFIHNLRLAKNYPNSDKL